MHESMLFAQKQAGDNRLSKDNAALLFIDHQTGLFQLVRDYHYDEFKNNVLALAAIGTLFHLPTILTTSFESGPNGPLIPELKHTFPKAPFIPRPGQINAWDNEDFVKAVKATGRKKLIIAGIVTDVCVVFPAISALSEGYDVYVVVDASGTFNLATRHAALSRMAQCGAVLTNWFSIGSELQRDWRDKGEGLTQLLKDHLVPYANLICSHEVSHDAEQET
ncbi:isochorismate family cysteine hydrolase YcaC [Rickettsiella grylli]|uniref:Isochorismatase family protein n=1 Tax=Rickettsiella grylli TaxID=59196 RepID=A8PN27_9COXI|nr:isochorismate family cysteine hydrolase YcaC [Rickettsiella grylli]EDP46210.1 isochorismatase family protein [Rickettsiella grylli]